MLSEWIRKFLEYCEVTKNQSPRTIVNYAHYLERFLAFSSDIDVSKIDLNLIHRYRLHLNRLGDLSIKTQNYHVIELRAFLNILSKMMFGL